MARTSSDILRDARWLAHRYDPQRDAVHFRHVPRSAHQQATFLTDEYLGTTTDPVAMARRDIGDSSLPQAPLHFIFHSAFCLSTLLARAFDLPGVAMALKEPVILNDIVGWRHRGADGAGLTAVLRDALSLLARPFSSGETVIVKPSNVTNGLAHGIMSMKQDSRALLLSAPLEDYLTSIAKKQMDGRLWVRDLLIKQLRDDLVLPIFSDEELLELTDLQVAAVGWLSQHALFARLAATFPDRIRTLDSATFSRAPDATMHALSAFFGLAISEKEIAGILAGDAFTRHSKHGTRFGFAAREAEYAEAQATYGDESHKVMVWAQAVARSANVALGLPRSLVV